MDSYLDLKMNQQYKINHRAGVTLHPGPPSVGEFPRYEYTNKKIKETNNYGSYEECKQGSKTCI